MRLFLFLVTLVVFLGCSVEKGAKSSSSVLKITNSSDIKIYILLDTGIYRESFGVVGPGGSKGIGFSPMRFSSETIIKWGEDTIQKDKQVSINTEKLLNLNYEVDEVLFQYYGHGKWELSVMDLNGKITVL